MIEASRAASSEVVSGMLEVTLQVRVAQALGRRILLPEVGGDGLLWVKGLEHLLWGRASLVVDGVVLHV